MDVLVDTLLDVMKLIPFLFLTYWLLEYLERHTTTPILMILQKANRLGPIWGSILGALPQCGISAITSNLYAARVVSIGTLLAVYLSTSDEMLPILLSQGVAFSLIGEIIGLKILCGMVVGYFLDLILFRKQTLKEIHPEHIGDMFEQNRCNCPLSIIAATVMRTLRISGLLFCILLVLNYMVTSIGHDDMVSLFQQQPIVGIFIAALMGLIPNCAPSVLLTELYLEGVLPFAQMFAGLAANGGTGFLILMTVNRRWKENVMILVLQLVFGIGAGILLLMTA